MSISKLLLVVSAAMTVTACASTGHFDPATGQSVSVVESGTCVPGEKQDGKSCVCSRKNGNYTNCTMQVLGKAPPTPQYLITRCLGQTEMTYQQCISHPGFYNGSDGQPYRCEYTGDPRCGYMPRPVFPQSRQCHPTLSSPFWVWCR